MKITSARLFIRQFDGRQMLLGIIVGDGLPSMRAEHLHDVTIMDYDGSLTITIGKIGEPWANSENHGDLSAWRADQILTGAFRMKGEMEKS
jgi:hypothetical protein